MSNLKALKVVALPSFLGDNLRCQIYELSAFCAVALSPVFNSACLTKTKFLDLKSYGLSTDLIHSTRLKLHEHSAMNITSISQGIKIDVDALKLLV